MADFAGLIRQQKESLIRSNEIFVIFYLIETSREHAIVYSAKATIYLPSITVYESSSLVTGSGSRKQNATFTSSFSTQLSRKVASHSLVRQDSNSFLKTSGIQNHWHEAYSFTQHETSSKTKNTASTASVWLTASLQSVTASALSFSDESRSKMSYSLKENASFVTTTPPSAQSSTKSLKNVETVIRRSPNGSLKHTWLPSGTEIRKFSSRRNFTTSGDNNKFPQTTKQSRQSPVWRDKFYYCDSVQATISITKHFGEIK